MKKRILTVSSANMDFVMNVSRIPMAGQTVIDRGSYKFVPGGKGANAAITISRLGGDSIFCTRLGRDQNGSVLNSLYNKEGIDTRFVKQDPESSTGLAAITIEPGGQNRITVFPGANMTISEDDVDSAMLTLPDALFMQLEIPHDIVIYAAERAAAKRIPIFLDAGPADLSFPLDRLPRLEVFSPNENETAMFTGISPTDPDSCLRAAIALSKLVDAKYYVIKLGSRGCYIYDGKYYFCLPAYDVPAVDTTAAGDAFTSALTLEYLRTGDIEHAGKYANAVGALVVARPGASSSIPTSELLRAFIRKNGIEL